jgi:hypothetical protein
VQSLPFPKTIEEHPIEIITLTTYAFRKASAHHKTLEKKNLQQTTQALHIHTNINDYN